MVPLPFPVRLHRSRHGRTEERFRTAREARSLRPLSQAHRPRQWPIQGSAVGDRSWHALPRGARLLAFVDLGGNGLGVAERLDQRQDLRLQDRSEEHTSELQSLMRISYAVFCLKKKKNRNLANNESIQHTNSQNETDQIKA